MPTLEMLRLDRAPFSHSSAIIAISGFLSKNKDKEKEWRELLTYMKQEGSSSNVYGLNWDATNPSEIAKKYGIEACEMVTGLANTVY